MLLPRVFGEEKGSVEIKEGRVSSKAKHQKKTTKSRFKLLLVYIKPVTLACNMSTIMQIVQ